MRRPSRNLQVFSLSALDLIAMATGVFVLLLVPSVAFSALGAMGRTMFRDVGRWNAWYVYFRNLWPPVPEGMPVYNLGLYSFPLRHVLVWVALGVGALAAWRVLARRGELTG